jgi:glycosyltransferase involved in cell wall biosynthesis
MKLLSISVAAYNVEKYLRQTLESFVISSDLLKKIEVIIVSDGSTDRTIDIAKEFEDKYPDCFVVIDKENGGYGSTINSSLRIARGSYFKTVDGDDWVDKKGLETLVKRLDGCQVDLVISKYSTVSDVDGRIDEITNGLRYDNKVNCFDEMLENEHPPFLSMHALSFKTELLRSHQIEITEKCFYTDAELVMKPIPYIDTVMKIDANVYMYRVGREGQSVSLKSRLKHMDQSIYVNLEKCILMQKVYLDNSVSVIKKQYLFDAIIHDIAIQYYFLLAYDKKKDILVALDSFDQDVKKRSLYVYENVLNTKYSSIISFLRKNNFRKLGLKLFLYHLKLKYVDLNR